MVYQMKIIKKDRHETYRELGEYLNIQKDNAFFNTEIKKWKPLRTLKQNSFEHLLYDYVGYKLGMDPGIVKIGIKEKFGPFIMSFEKLVPKPSHLCDIEEISPRIEGCFAEAGDQGIDMREFIERWQEIKQVEIEKKKEILEV